MIGLNFPDESQYFMLELHDETQAFAWLMSRARPTKTFAFYVSRLLSA